MHEIVYVPALVFSCTAAIAWAVTLVINLRETGAGKFIPAAAGGPVAFAAEAAPRQIFRPVVIQGGLAEAPVYFRAAKTPLRSASGAAKPRARSYGG